MTAEATIAIIGSGNVAFHLKRAMSRTLPVVTVNPRTLEGLPPHADLYLICVSDNAIADVAARLPHCGMTVAHTSGTTPLSTLSDAGYSRAGVLYPLQTFSKDVSLDYNRIPVFTEASDPQTMEVVMRAATAVSPRVLTADSQQRRALHLASVLACNFVNHLWTLADNVLTHAALDFDVLHPLIEETTAKLNHTSPLEGQTGPARRGDTLTMQAHLDMLSELPELQEIYRLLSLSIFNTYHRP